MALGDLDGDGSLDMVVANSAESDISVLINNGDGTFADCSSPKTFAGLPNGSHTVAIRAEDSDGNQDPTPATRTFTVDASGPTVVKARIGKVTVKGPAKVKKGKKVTSP